MILFKGPGGERIDPSGTVDAIKRFKSLSPEIQTREKKAYDQIYDVMERFKRWESNVENYEKKEAIVFDWSARGAFAPYPPERWPGLVSGLYLSLTSSRN